MDTIGQLLGNSEREHVPRCGRTLELAEIWGPKRGYIWMKRWLETHRLRIAARQAIQQLREARFLHYRQLAFKFHP